MNPSASLHSCAKPQIIFLIILNEITDLSFIACGHFNVLALVVQELNSIHWTYKAFPSYFMLVNTNWGGLTCGVAEL